MKRILISAVLVGGLAMAATAQAGDRTSRRHDGDRGHRVDARDARHGHAARPALRNARRIDRRLDRKGQVIDRHLDFLAFVAAVSGEHALAGELDRTGDRIERRYDRRGDRIVHKARKQTRRHGHFDRDRKHKRHAKKHNHDRHRAKARKVAHRHHDDCGHSRSNRSTRRHGGSRVDRHFIQHNTRFR